MSFALVTRTSNGGTPLTGDQIDSNWNAIATAIIALQALVPTLTIAASADGKSMVFSINGVVAATLPFPLPTGFNPRGAYAVGATYKIGDSFTYQRSTYWCKVATYTAVSITADVNAGNATLLAGAGGPGYTLQGVYDNTRTYNVSDAVTMTGSTTIWVLTKAAAAGTSPPTTASPTSAYWAASAVGVPFPSTYVTDQTQTTTLDQVIANISSDLKAINAKLTSPATLKTK